MHNLFDHIDMRVRDLTVAKAFYDQILPPLGFSVFRQAAEWIAYELPLARYQGPFPPPFFGFIEDKNHLPSATRIAFRVEDRALVDQLGKIIVQAGAKNVEGPMPCPEYDDKYYAIFFEDPCGNRLEVCFRGRSIEEGGS